MGSASARKMTNPDARDAGAAAARYAKTTGEGGMRKRERGVVGGDRGAETRNKAPGSPIVVSLIDDGVALPVAAGPQG